MDVKNAVLNERWNKMRYTAIYNTAYKINILQEHVQQLNTLEGMPLH